MGDLLPGDIIGFCSRDVIADTICVMSGALPGGIHHVGIVGGMPGAPLIYESCTSLRPPCYHAGKLVKGVQAHTVDELLEFISTRKTRLWHYRQRHPLYLHEAARLEHWLRQRIGLPYDLDGALHAGGGILFRTLALLIRGENLAGMFCSELAAAGLVHVGRLQTRSASRWNPTKLCRTLVRFGRCDKPTLLLDY